MKRKAFKAAFPHTVPIMFGFIFLGISYGFMTVSKGFPPVYPILMAACIYAGSMEFVAVNLLLSAFNPVHAFFLTLIINARHLFYGISMLDVYRGKGWKKPFLIFGMSDETFTVNYTSVIPKDVDEGWFMLFVTWLDQSYWVIGSALGALLGSLIHFNSTGIDFVMTALFVCMLVDQWKDQANRESIMVGVLCTFICLMTLGSSHFILPAMVLIIFSFALDDYKKEEAV